MNPQAKAFNRVSFVGLSIWHHPHMSLFVRSMGRDRADYTAACMEWAAQAYDNGAMPNLAGGNGRDGVGVDG